MAGVPFKTFVSLEMRPAKTHFNLSDNPSRYARQPLCGATTMDGSEPAMGKYTYNSEEVTCKRCLKCFEKMLDEIVRDFVKRHPQFAPPKPPKPPRAPRKPKAAPPAP